MKATKLIYSTIKIKDTEVLRRQNLGNIPLWFPDIPEMGG